MASVLTRSAEEPALGVERQLGVGDVVAGVLVGEDRLAALADPLDRPAQLLRGEQHEPVLGVLPALGAEAAADIAGDHPDAALRDLEDAGRERLPHAVRVLHVGVERVALLARVPHAERAARLHEMRVDPADHVAALDDMRGAGAKAASVAALLPVSNRFEMLSGHSSQTGIFPSAASAVSVTEGRIS